MLSLYIPCSRIVFDICVSTFAAKKPVASLGASEAEWHFGILTIGLPRWKKPFVLRMHCCITAVFETEQACLALSNLLHRATRFLMESKCKGPQVLAVQVKRAVWIDAEPSTTLNKVFFFFFYCLSPEFSKTTAHKFVSTLFSGCFVPLGVMSPAGVPQQEQ